MVIKQLKVGQIISWPESVLSLFFSWHAKCDKSWEFCIEKWLNKKRNKIGTTRRRLGRGQIKKCSHIHASWCQACQHYRPNERPIGGCPLLPWNLKWYCHNKDNWIYYISAIYTEWGVVERHVAMAKPSKELFTVLLCLSAKYKLDSGDRTQGLTVASLLLQPLCYLLQ